MFAKASKKQSSSNGWVDFCVTITTVPALLHNGREKSWVYFTRRQTPFSLPLTLAARKRRQLIDFTCSSRKQCKLSDCQVRKAI